jgi:outer membrane protein, multidrug efflux system
MTTRHLFRRRVEQGSFRSPVELGSRQSRVEQGCHRRVEQGFSPALHRHVLALPLVLGLLAGACTVGPNYTKPDLQPPPVYRGQATTSPESIADTGWWKVFDDAALFNLVREGVANNLDLKIASARVAESRELVGIAKSFRYPDVNAGFGVTGEQASRLGQPPLPKETYPDRRYTNWAMTGSVSWDTDLFGRLRRGQEAAFNRYLATEEGRRAVLVALVGDIASTYYFLCELDLQLEIAQRTLKINDDTVTYYSTRLTGGVSNRLEVDQAKGNRALTAATIPDLERQIALAENALSVLLGKPPGPVQRSSLGDRTVPPRVPVGLPAQLLERRPDVLAAERLLAAANADIGAAKALFYPTISLTGSAGSVSGSLSDFMRPDAIVWSLGAGLLQPIFNGGRIKANYQAAMARYDQALGEYQRAALVSYREVADSLVTIEKLAQRRTEVESGVEALRDATQLSRARYDTGLSSYLEVLVADQQLFQQEQQLAITRGEQFRALADLYRSMGGGWQPETSAPPPAPPK